MKKTKFMMTGFSVFSALLMLMTTCMARPVQEKTNMDAVEDLEKELIGSLDVLNTKLTRDTEVNGLVNTLIRNRDVAAILGTIERADSEEEIIYGVEQLAGVIQDYSEIEQLTILVGEEYSAELGTISEILSSMGFECSTHIFSIIAIVIILIIGIIANVVISIIYNIINFLRWLWSIIFGDGDDR